MVLNLCSPSPRGDCVARQVGPTNLPGVLMWYAAIHERLCRCVVTVLGGKHTISECSDLMKTVEFRIKAGNRVNAGITQAQIDAAGVQAMSDLQFDWSNFQARWATMRADVMPRLLFANAGQPLVPSSLIPVEAEYQLVLHAINISGDQSFQRGDLTDCLNRIEAIAGVAIDEKDHPMPTGFDPEIVAYKVLDKAIRSGEALTGGTLGSDMVWLTVAAGAVAAAYVVRTFVPWKG